MEFRDLPRYYADALAKWGEELDAWDANMLSAGEKLALLDRFEVEGFEMTYGMAFQSTDEYAHERLTGKPGVFTAAWVQYCATWPLPGGAKAISEWWSGYKPHFGKKPSLPPSPLIGREDALIGLALSHTEDETRIWLLGLVVETGSIAGIVSYGFSAPVLQVEGDLSDPAIAEARKIQQWYLKSILGKTLRGRPVGSNKKQVYGGLIEKTIRTIRMYLDAHDGDLPDQPAIAKLLNTTVKEIQRAEKTFELSWTDLLERAAKDR